MKSATKEKRIPTLPTIPCPYPRLLSTTEDAKPKKIIETVGIKNLEERIFLKKDEGLSPEALAKGGANADTDGISPNIGIFHPLCT